MIGSRTLDDPKGAFPAVTIAGTSSGAAFHCFFLGGRL
jgi:hypothetical protein